MNGTIVIDKPQGFTSFDVVAKLRGICQTKKIGHGGTLDPMATGVLPVFIGPAAKAVDLQPRQDKEYEAELLFGTATDTGDITGEVIERGQAQIDRVTFERAIDQFRGICEQLPPMYSAVKVDGKPLYRYAREGKEVNRKPRTVTFYEIENLGPVGSDRWRLRVHCSKGTYIRTLAEELGRAVGSCATLTSLRRTAAGVFTLRDAYSLQELQKAKDEGELERCLGGLERVFAELTGFEIEKRELGRLLNGAFLYGKKQVPGRYGIYLDGTFVGLGRLQEDGSLRAEKMFVERDGACS